jgi:hypothetical protein
MSDIIDLHKEFKEEVEKQKFLEAQHKTIIELTKRNKELESEIVQLKQLLITPVENKVEKIIVTPEQALIDGQIDLIQNKGLFQELTLEDVKKLDLLIKNKQLLKKENPETIKGESKPAKMPINKLLEIASKNE